MDDPSETPEPDLLQIRFIKRLVTVLTATMIAGVLVIIVLLVIRLREPLPLALPEDLALPEGAVAEAVTTSRERVLVVTEDGRLLVFARDGSLSQTIPLEGPEAGR
ncbi:DUF6476 family protein [Roseivivax sp. GX 12232]|uniref:DUF6476 family protein n=1 Tax=Roseivivax sp. GX 12232 TaxID=2900547 RepID=UPI001E52CCC3|nr:DUF6476 family protein [Roseivivax sp. GX 12232]MCE0505260.1 DUF6476 family protein [Roseivivax sp. GX 12232]